MTASLLFSCTALPPAVDAGIFLDAGKILDAGTIANDAGSAADAGSSTVLSDCRKIVDQFCPYYVRCGIAIDVEACRQSLDVNCRQTSQSVAGGTQSFNDISACAASYVSSSCRGFPICGAFGKPNVPKGGVCRVSADCQNETLSTNLSCGGSTCPSTCSENIVGSTCSIGSCGPNLWCDVSVGYCKAKVGPGQECGTIFDVRCNEASTCNRTTNLCVALPPVGSPCFEFQCQSNAYCGAVKWTQKIGPAG
jgi:hypothetical protein